MKSEQNANPAPADDEEVIELTDILKPGPDAEETIVELTDVVETVKAESHGPATAFDQDQPLELGENAIAEVDADEPLVDLTDALDSPELAVSDNASDLSDDVSDEAQALLDLDEILDDDADNDLALDLEDALETPDDETTILDLNESLVEDSLTEDDPQRGAFDEHAFDDGDTTADIAEEIEVDAEALDLAEILDAAEEEEDFLALDTPQDDADMMEEASDLAVLDAPTLGETLEVIEADPVEDPLADLDTSMDDTGLANPFLDAVADELEADESDDILDLDQFVEPKADEETTEAVGSQNSGAASAPAPGGLFGADDTGDDLDFKLDEMLAEAQAEMPDLDDDDADIELDLSEALAEAAADSAGRDPDAIIELNDPVATVPDVLGFGDTAADEADEFDLISEDKIIELDDPVAVENLTEIASKRDNVIELADVTGGYPTVNPTSEFDLDASGEASPSEEVSLAEELPAETDALLEDVFLDEDTSADSILATEPEDEDHDLGITLDDTDDAEAEEEEDFQLSPEMEKLEATLDDVFQDDEGDDLDLAMLADNASDDGADESKSEGAVPAADMAAVGLVDADPAPVATQAPVGDLPAEITEEVLDAAVSRVIKTMYADRIEQMILDVIKEAVTAEIDKVKRSLGDKA